MAMSAVNGKRPLIGLTCDVDQADGRYFLRPPYVEAVLRAGGMPMLLPPCVDLVNEFAGRCDGFVFTGGDDPLMEDFGGVTHEKATPVARVRQDFEVALLDALETKRDKPILGICLGMQMMALVRGGELAQYLPESLETHALHWGKKRHGIVGVVGEGEILSHHKQALTNAGVGFEVVGVAADDGVIEAIEDVNWGSMCLGVQWHPERSGRGVLGDGVMARLVGAAAVGVVLG